MPKSNSKQVYSKILLIGLDNCGKSSILLSLRKKTSLSNFTSLKPTRGFEQEEIKDQDNTFILWDIGGQEQVRIDFLKKFDETIEGTNKIIFIIDVQDTKRYEKALNYLEKILDLLKAKNLIVNLSIFLHKYDSGIKFKEKIIAELIDKIKEMIPQNFNYDIFKTTIFTIFQKTSVI
ncbi:MAG: ADP-ribosylation factor-like protein [Promethearchaeota archaeon]